MIDWNVDNDVDVDEVLSFEEHGLESLSISLDKFVYPLERKYFIATCFRK